MLGKGGDEGGGGSGGGGGDGGGGDGDRGFGGDGGGGGGDDGVGFAGGSGWQERNHYNKFYHLSGGVLRLQYLSVFLLGVIVVLVVVVDL